MNDHVTKPIDPEKLFATLAKWVSISKKPGREVRAKETFAVADRSAPTIAASPEAEPDLSEIPGFDAGSGLLRVAGNKKLYNKLLLQFAEEYADAAETLGKALAAGDPATAGRLAHTVKGVAANLGAVAVQAASAEIEKAIRDGLSPEGIELLRTRLAEVLVPLTDRLRAALSEARPGSPATPVMAVDPVRVKAAATEMLKYLTDFDAAAVDCLEANREILRQFFVPVEFALFEKRVGSFAFSEAREQVDKALKEHLAT
jgi:two-component system sensor histidine kinase/response regulator